MKTAKQIAPTVSKATALTLALIPIFADAKDLNMNDGWSGSIGVQIQAFALSNDTADPNAVGGLNGGTDQDTFRVQSGFDPSKLTVGVSTPNLNGITAAGTVQLAMPIQGNKSKLAGGQNDSLEVRIAELTLSGDFGTVKIGRGWNIFSSSSLIHDSGSLPGVGIACNGVDGAGATCGRIGTGYTWTAFSAGVQYASPNYGGFSYRLGIFDPIENLNDSSDNDLQSNDPRFEGEINYNSDLLDVWASFMRQSYDNTGGASGDDIQGFDIGAEVRIGGLALTGAFTDTAGALLGLPGLGLCEGSNCESVESEMWYAEADYTFGNTLIGVSYGEGEDNFPGAADPLETDLAMFFVHHKINDHVTLVAEINQSNTENGSGNQAEQRVIALGAELNF